MKYKKQIKKLHRKMKKTKNPIIKMGLRAIKSLWKEEKNNVVGHRANNKTTAKKRAKKLRKKGLDASIYKKKKGWGVSSRRKK